VPKRHKIQGLTVKNSSKWTRRCRILHLGSRDRMLGRGHGAVTGTETCSARVKTFTFDVEASPDLKELAAVWAEQLGGGHRAAHYLDQICLVRLTVATEIIRHASPPSNRTLPPSRGGPPQRASLKMPLRPRKKTAMRKVLPCVLTLPMIAACVAATCSCSSNVSSTTASPISP